MFAKKYFDEVLDERGAKRNTETSPVYREHKKEAADRFRDDVKNRRDEVLEKVLKKEKVETPADMYFEDRHWKLLGQKESKGVYDKINTEGGGMGALGKYQSKKVFKCT